MNKLFVVVTEIIIILLFFAKTLSVAICINDGNNFLAVNWMAEKKIKYLETIA